MDFEEFREKLKEDLGERLFARTGDEFEITSSSVTKLQNATSLHVTTVHLSVHIFFCLDKIDSRRSFNYEE